MSSIVTVIPVYIDPSRLDLKLPNAGQFLAVKDGDEMEYGASPFSRHIKHLSALKDVFIGEADLVGIVWHTQPRQLMAHENIALIAVMLRGTALMLPLDNNDDDVQLSTVSGALFSDHNRLDTRNCNELCPGENLYLRFESLSIFVGIVVSHGRVFIKDPSSSRVHARLCH